MVKAQMGWLLPTGLIPVAVGTSSPRPFSPDRAIQPDSPKVKVEEASGPLVTRRCMGSLTTNFSRANLEGRAIKGDGLYPYKVTSKSMRPTTYSLMPSVKIPVWREVHTQA